MHNILRLLLGCAFLAVPAAAEVPRVVTDIPPVHSLAAQVMGDLGQPLLLLDRGADAHDFQLRPSQIDALAKADLVIWIGPDMSPWLERSLDSLGGANNLALLEQPGTNVRPYGSGGHMQDDDDHDHSGAEDPGPGDTDDAGGTHAHGAHDPHAWLDPANAQVWLGLIATALTDLDPPNAETYVANARAAAERIASLDTVLADRLAPVRERPFVVFHDAFGYFGDHYDLTVAGTVALGDAAAPGAARLTDLRSTMQAGVPVCIFPESNHDPKLIGLMAEGTGVRIGTPLDPEGAVLDPGPDLYEALLVGLADALEGCLAAP